MLINPDSATTNSSITPPPPPPTSCSNCGLVERRLLYHVRHRGVFRRLCTSCVLRLHPQSFCPTCFIVYPPVPTNDAALTCFKCYSSSHSDCIPNSPSNPYTCPLCIHPNSPIFKLKPSDANSKIDEGANSKIENFRSMDRDAARKLRAASKIASLSMNKAAVAAKAEAERRAKEAAYARKRAKEALEHVSHLVMREKLRKKEAPTNGGYTVRTVKIDQASNVNSRSNNGNVSPLNALEKPNVAGITDRNNSSQVLAALDAVELRENGDYENTNDSDHVNLSDMTEEKIDDVDNEASLVQHMVQNNSIKGEQKSSNHGSL